MHYPHIEPLEARIAPATLTLGNARIVEGDSGTTALTFTATLDVAVAGDVTFNLATQSGTAIAGSDFVAKAADVTITAGQKTATFAVTIIGDNAFEATESVFVNLTDLRGTPVTVVNNNPVTPSALATARGYIFNDDTQNLSPTKAQWIDVDGDLVTMTVSKGLIPVTNTDLFTFVSGGSIVGGQQLQRLDLARYGSTFAGASVSIVATKQAGFPDASDGEVDVGYIKGTTFDPDELRAVGVDLKNVTVDGDLAKITAGDSFATPAIGKLDLVSLGTRGTATLAPADTPTDPNSVVESKILGPISSIVVRDDVNSFLRVIGEEFGVISSLKIGGSLKGVGTKIASGAISLSGKLGTATIGNIIGAGGANSGLLLASSLGNGSLGSITVTGSVTGGAGADSGQIQAPKIGTVKVGTVVGGDGARSGYILSNSSLGNVTLTGDLVGGSVADSGEIAAQGSIGAVKIGAKIVGAGGENSGSLRTARGIASLSVAGTLAGAVGTGSGSVQTNENIGAVSFGKNVTGDSVIGGTGTDSGGLKIGGNIASFTAAGNVKGAAANGSGAILSGGTIGKLDITGSLIGGSSGATALDKTGYIFAQRLTAVTIGGDIISGTRGTAGLSNSGAIRADVIGALTVTGKLTGSALNPVIISATGLASDLAIKSVNIGGDVTQAEILAGYNSNATAANFRGVAASADASIGAVVFGGTVTGLNVIAGGLPGTDTFFGTADDRLANGTIAGSAPVKDIPSVISRIASVVFQSPTAIVSNPMPSVFGIVAQHVVAVKIGTMSVPLKIGPGNDVAASATDPEPGVELKPGSRFRALELLLPA